MNTSTELNYVSVDFDPFADGEENFNYSVIDFDPFADGEILLTAPTTQAQQEIWHCSQLGKEANLAFNISYSLSLQGNLNIELFKKSISYVIQRHEALRINFSPDGKQLLIYPSLNIDIPVINLTHYSAQEQENQLIQIKQKIVKTPFNLEKDSLFRVTIIKLNPEKYLVIFCTHQIICDPWAWWVLINDLGKIYSSLNKGSEPSLPQAESFSQYAISEWEINHQIAHQETQQFWCKQFSDFIPLVSFPTDLPRPNTRTFNCDRENWLLPETLISKLKTLGIKQGCSFMPTFLAAFEIFLAKITAKNDFNIGVSRSGQAFAGKYNLMGYCVNLLPIRTKIDLKQNFKTYLKSRNSAILDAFDYQQMNFSHLAEKFSIPVEKSSIPLLPIAITVQDIEAESFDFDDLKVKFVYEKREFNSFEIDLEIVIIGDEINLQCHYNTNLFSPQNIRSRLEEFAVLLTNIIENPQLPIDQIPLEPTGDLLKKNIPLSFAQKSLWFVSELEGANPAYNISTAWKIIGNLNINILEKAINQMIERHEILRTNFIKNSEGEPTAIVHKKSSFALNFINLEYQSNKSQEAELLIKEASAKIFDLAQDSLIRSTVVKLEETVYLLLITVHHIIFDGWSINLFRQELSEIYTALSQNQLPSLPELTIQYSDFTNWEKEYQLTSNFQEQISYWKDQLAQAPSLSTFPPDFPRPKKHTFSGKSYTYFLPPILKDQLNQFSRQENVTLFMTLLTAFNILLSRYSAENDLIIGIPVAGRNNLELKALMGFFVNTIVLRTNLDDEPDFRQLLQRVKNITLEAIEYQEIPFEKLVEELNPERNLSYNPIFQVLFNMLNLNYDPLTLGDLKVESLPFFEESSKFDITFYIIQEEEKIKFTWLYNEALYQPETIIRFNEHLQTILEGIVINPQQAISSLPRPLMPPNFPDPSIKIEEPNYPLLTQQFEDWVKKTPEKIAICQSKNQWTYQKLFERSLELAKILLASDLKQGEVVAVYGQKTFGLIVSMMAVLLSGGVLLSLDHNLNQERQKAMLSQGKVRLILSVENQIPTFEDQQLSLQEIKIDPDRAVVNKLNPELKQKVASQKLPSLAPDDPAYVFFTSGTTGVPKGVLGCHKGLAHFLSWQKTTFKIEPDDRGAQLTSLSFDVILRDIFLPLVSGATLCLPPKNYDLSPEFILPWLVEQKITYFHTVPTLAKTWLTNIPPNFSLKSLRRIFFSGEPLTHSLIINWRKAFSQKAQIINFYGATETTLIKCFYVVPEKPIQGVQPIGFPQPQTQVLILNQHQQLCAIGEIGEIVIRTPFRSLGYLNNPQETQKRFMINPYTKNEKDLLYLTGDRGCYQSDGNIRILGRIDDQVKIRGIRIEPQEIAVVLSQYSKVDQAVVITKKQQNDDKYLVAYFVNKKGQTLTSEEIRNYLKQKLPDYMIPTAFVKLEKIPVNPNGKVNRNALPEPDLASQIEEKYLVEPRNEIERELVRIWQEILGAPKISINDNFFALGGHSLLAISLLSKINRELQLKLSLRQIIENPTIAQLVESNPQFNLTKIEPELPVEIKTIREGNPNFPVYFIHIEQEIFVRPIADLLDPKYSLYSVSSLGELITREIIDPNGSTISVEQLARNYVEALLKFQPTGPYYFLGVSFGGVMAYEMASQLLAKGHEVNNVILFDTGDLTPRNLLYIKAITLIGYFKKLIKKGPSYLKDRLVKKYHDLQYNLLEEDDFSINQGDIKDRVLSAEQKIVYQILNWNAKVKKSYTPKKYSGVLTLFFADEEMFLFRKGWKDLTDDKLKVVTIPGQHITMYEQPNVKILIAELEKILYSN